MRYHELGKTGYKVSYVAFGGVVSSQHFDKAVMPGDGQRSSDESVEWAIENGINYFDVAPVYGDAQLLLGNSLKPHRKDVYLACKTNRREKEEAQKDLEESLRLLHTDYFDVYQLHGLTTLEEVETCFGPGGAMEVLEEAKKSGVAKKLGITAHGEEAALKALEYYDFDTVMFPFNWHMHMGHNMGERLIREAKKRGMGILGIKSMVEREWSEEERYSSKYPKSWCKPFDIDTEPDMLLAGMRYSMSLGLDILVPPGNFDHFRFAVEHMDEVLDNPFSEEDRKKLEAHLEKVKERPFLEAI